STPGTPLSVTITPSSGIFSSATGPFPVTITTRDDALITSTYTVNYTNSGLGNCASGQLSTVTNTQVNATSLFTFVYDANNNAPLFFDQVSLCGPGTYTLNTVTTDFAGRAQIVTSTYTLVDLTPKNFVGKAVTDTAIAYTWTPSSATVG